MVNLALFLCDYFPFKAGANYHRPRIIDLAHIEHFLHDLTNALCRIIPDRNAIHVQSSTLGLQPIPHFSFKD